MELTFAIFSGLFLLAFLMSIGLIFAWNVCKKKYVEYKKFQKKQLEKEEKSKIVKRKITSEEKKWMSDEMKALSLPSNLNTVLYVYTLKIDGKQCLKIGITKSDILKRIIRYLFTEHYDQDKKIIDSFRMLYIHNFENDKVARKIEGAFKDRLSCFPLTEGQKWQTEQYMFKDAWDSVKDELNQRIIFSNGYWKRENFELIVPKTRLLIEVEPDKDSKLSRGQLKELIEGDEIVHKSLKFEPVDYPVKMACSDLPKLPGEKRDESAWRRIKSLEINTNKPNSEEKKLVKEKVD